jgi:CelD/BcsL family acetyltransferase involved in cellulose biosynthesis/glycosyltransferase involved in cell wall biosynthesis
MGLTVLNVAYPFAPVRPDAVGGAEQILGSLDRALVRAGHRSIVLACAGSKPAGVLVPMPAPRSIDASSRAAMEVVYKAAIEICARRFDVDVVHLHGVDFPAYLPECEAPILATLHLPPELYPRAIFEAPGAALTLCCVSSDQRARCPDGARRLELVENGIELERFAPRERKGRFAAALGRICPEKGYHLALDASAAASTPFLLAGRVFEYEAHRRYFEESIRPRLGPGRRFIGAIDPARRRALLARARCVVVPSVVEETSGLVVMEAMASGTPVVARRAGALPSLVDHGRTGFVVDDVEGMAEAIVASADLDPRACFDEAEARFSAERMHAGYLALYERLRAERRARTTRPIRGDAPTSGDAITTDELVGLDAAEALREVWGELWERSDALPFQRPEWVLAATRCLEPDAEVRVVLARRGTELVGLAPLALERDATGRPFARLLGGDVSDYLDVIVDRRCGREAATALLEHLRASPELGAFTLERLHARSALLDATWPRGSRLDEGDVCPAIRLPGRGGAFADAVPARLVKRVARARRRVHREGRFEVVEAGGDDLHGMLEGLYRLHAARWRVRGEGGVLADGAVRGLHAAALRDLHALGLARLLELRLDDRPVASVLAFMRGRRWLSYIGGFDPSLAALSPGHLAIAELIDRAIAAGAEELDFLRGVEPYKYEWGAENRTSYRLERRAQPSPLMP